MFDLAYTVHVMHHLTGMLIPQSTVLSASTPQCKYPSAISYLLRRTNNITCESEVFRYNFQVVIYKKVFSFGLLITDIETKTDMRHSHGSYINNCFSWNAFHLITLPPRNKGLDCVTYKDPSKILCVQAPPLVCMGDLFQGPPQILKP